ncbi:uncharacterized protein LOC131942679 isoform X2 [Physella acuta]|uniref:uncharacterized protein LOC131942679 isoform X2 n=1 Tax=Physella acuta TaxID=109671 RepID=UPI0027DD791C|nr:uncharacterized protein LOC131942679 isoform X2 [Physella acuta]
MIKGGAVTMMKLAVVSLFATYLTPGCCQNLCETMPPFYKNNNTCPEKAVCADVSIFNRTSPNKSPCERKTNLNCRCNQDIHCPLDDEHSFYVSNGVIQYTCDPRCSFPWCRENQIAKSSLANARDFGYKTYTKIECRCPGNHIASMKEGVAATKNSDKRIDNSQSYVCNQVFGNIDDPCSSKHPSG